MVYRAHLVKSAPQQQAIVQAVTIYIAAPVKLTAMCTFLTMPNTLTVKAIIKPIISIGFSKITLSILNSYRLRVFNKLLCSKRVAQIVQIIVAVKKISALVTTYIHFIKFDVICQEVLQNRQDPV